MKPLHKDFAIAFCLVSASLLILDPFLREFTGFARPRAYGIVELLPAIYYTSVKFGKRHDKMPKSGALWKIALQLTLIAVAVSIVLSLIFIVFPSGQGISVYFESIVYAVSVGPILRSIIFELAVYLILIRYVLPWAIRMQWKRAKR